MSRTQGCGPGVLCSGKWVTVVNEFSGGDAGGMAWQDRAACRNVDPDLFYRRDGEQRVAAQLRFSRAKRICADCPVLARCREEAFRLDDQFAVLGGLTPDERDAARGRYAPHAKPVPGREDSVIDALVEGEDVEDASRINIAYACVRLWRRGGVSQAALARRFGLTPNTVRNWVSRAERGGPPISPKWWAQQHGLPFSEVS